MTTKAERALTLVEAKLRAAVCEHFDKDPPKGTALLGLLKTVWEAQGDPQTDHSELATEITDKMLTILSEGVRDVDEGF